MVTLSSAEGNTADISERKTTVSLAGLAQAAAKERQAEEKDKLQSCVSPVCGILQNGSKFASAKILFSVDRQSVRLHVQLMQMQSFASHQTFSPAFLPYHVGQPSFVMGNESIQLEARTLVLA